MIVKRNFIWTLVGGGLLLGVLIGGIILFAALTFMGTGSSSGGGEEAQPPALTESASPQQNPQKGDVPVSAQIGGLSPDFSLTALDGSTFTLSETRGRPVVLNFWATWCPPCRAEMPAIQSRAAEWGDDLLVVGIEVGEPPDEVQAFVDRFGLTFPIVLDRNGKVSRRYLVQGLPTTVVLDAEGIVQARHVGAMTARDLDRYLAQVGLKR